MNESLAGLDAASKKAQDAERALQALQTERCCSRTPAWFSGARLGPWLMTSAAVGTRAGSHVCCHAARATLAETAAALRRELSTATRRTDELASQAAKAPPSRAVQSTVSSAAPEGGPSSETAQLRARVDDLARKLRLAEAEVEDADKEAEVCRPGLVSCLVGLSAPFRRSRIQVGPALRSR